MVFNRLYLLVVSILVMVLSMAIAYGGEKQMLSEQEQAIQQHVITNEQQQLAVLEQLVNINSGTMNFSGVQAVADVLADYLRDLNFTVTWESMVDQTDRAGHLIAQREGSSGQHVLLMGHLDTVFPEDSSFQIFEQKDGYAYGPGVVDMKGGIVVLLSALQALEANGALDDKTVTVILTGDEEAPGAPEEITRRALLEAAQAADVALSFEVARDNSSAVISRRGYTRWTLVVEGEAGHSSGIFTAAAGQSAIYEVARILHEFQTQLESIHGLAVNPGILLAGSEIMLAENNTRGEVAGKRNVIASEAIVHGDVRALTIEQLQQAQQIMQTIVDQHAQATTVRIEFKNSKLPFAATDASYELLQQFSEVNQALGLPAMQAVDPLTSGASDVNYISGIVVGMDGLGPIGTGLHSEDETLEVASLSMGAQRAAILIYRLLHTEPQSAA